MIIPFCLKETYGVERSREPVTIGVPISRGLMQASSHAAIKDPTGSTLPAQITPLALWPDKTYKWILLDCQLSVDAGTEDKYLLVFDQGELDSSQSIVIIDEENWHVNTGPTSFTFNLTPGSALISCYQSDSREIGTFDFILNVNNSKNEKCNLQINSINTELRGPLRSVIKVQGIYSQGARKLAAFLIRVHFFAGKSFVKIESTLHNQNPAKHQGGLWDLGDCGSLLIKRFTCVFQFNHPKSRSIYAQTDLGSQLTHIPGNSFSIYQGSSGGANWKSLNHIDSEGQVSLPFCGYQSFLDGQPHKIGKRSTPLFYLGEGSIGASCFFPHFWQNFPKSLAAEDNCLKIGLFPDYADGQHELQGGEQKTHVFYMDVSSTHDTLNWLYAPLTPLLLFEWYKETETIPYLCNKQSKSEIINRLTLGVVEGKNSFFQRREIIDEYGWRNFGDVYADHEAVGYKGPPPLISHYNNQYDLIYGLIRLYIQKSSSPCRQLFDDLARHVIDIDIYRTTGDRAEFNGGLFWHTDHYLDASTSTHRTVSKSHLQFVDPKYCGGGPGLEHNYTSGLMNYYYLTGNHQAKETVILLADWVRNVNNLPDTLLGFIYDIKRKTPIWKQVLKGEQIRSDRFPFSRSSGNSINTLLDAFTLSNNNKYLFSAETIIAECIHPLDDIQSRDLLNAELHWSYNVCLQAIGKYLDLKIELQEIDNMYGYAQKSLIHYAEWMADNEYLYLDKSENLEYPNETWPTQDLRKSCVLYLASKHSEGPQKKEFAQKAAFFFEFAIEQLNQFETKTLVRPLALLMQNSWMHDYFQQHPTVSAPLSDKNFTSHPNEFWNKSNILKYCLRNLLKITRNTSLQQEKHWLKCRKNQHVQ